MLLLQYAWCPKHRTVIDRARTGLIDRGAMSPCFCAALCSYQCGVDGRGIRSVLEVVGVRVCRRVRRAVDTQRRTQLCARSRHQPLLTGGRAAEGGGGGGGGLGSARAVRYRPGNRIAASRTGLWRHEKLHEEKKNHGRRRYFCFFNAS